MFTRNHRQIPITPIVLTLALCCLFPLTASADMTLVGDTVNAELILGSNAKETIKPSSAMVGAGSEFTIYPSSNSKRPLFTIDISDNSIFMKIGNTSYSTANKSTLLRNLRISDIDWIGDPSAVIDGFTLTLGSDWPYSDKVPEGITARDITFTDDSITFDFAGGARWYRYNWVRIDLSASPGPVVPVPSSILLACIGLGCASRKLRKRSVS
jgi:hypothetical protein